MDQEPVTSNSHLAVRSSLRDSATRTGKLVAVLLLISVSLLTFPAGLPWVMLGWLLFTGLSLFRNKTPLSGLLILMAVIVIRNPEWSVALVGFMFLCGSTTILYFARLQTTKPFWPILVLLAIWMVFQLDFWRVASRSITGERSTVNGPVTESRDIVCLGDSLTACGYPDELQKLVHNPVVDYGRDGITSEDGLDVMDEILALSPRVLVLELGGHDYNQGRTRSNTIQNLSRIIERCQHNGTRVLLVEVPRGFIRDPFRGMERQLARKYKLGLVSDGLIRNFVLFSPVCPPGTWLSQDKHLSNDGLHPNQRGNQLFARTVADELVKMLGNEILKR